MAEKKVSTCCKREIAHKKDGTPYTHKCYALPEDPFVVPGQLPDNNPDAKRGAVDPFESPTKPLGKSPFDVPKDDGPGPWFPAGFEQECDGCGGVILKGDEIRADGNGGWECQENCGDEEPHPDESPTHTHHYVWADDDNGHSGSFCACGAEEPEPTTDHRKWCTRCKLLGHYSADCTTAVLSGGVVSVPVSLNQATVNGMVSVPVVTLPPEEGGVVTFPSGATFSGLDQLTQPAPEEAGGECECGRATSNDNEVCDTCAAEPEPQHLYVDLSGVRWTHPGPGYECKLPECLPMDSQLAEFLAPLPREGTEANVSGVAALVETGARVREGLSDPFTTPTQPAEKVNVSGQPSSRYEWYGKQNRGYLVKLPETGDFRRHKNGKPKGLTRATTFNKAATDQNSLTDWAKRNVLIGASKRPDLVAKAHGLTHEDNRDQLMKLVAELETTAGAKVSADVGTLIHELTERWDAGVLDFSHVPAAYLPLLRKYQSALDEAGLRPVAGLIERTTYIPQFGGVVGTLDRVYYHEPSGRYVIGDVKTGKTLEYGMDEIETQEWIYAHGVNNAGVYDWNTDEWEAPEMAVTAHHGAKSDRLTVSEEWGVVVHMPVQGDDAGKVTLVRADLQRGKRHAEVCHDVRVQRANKPKPEPWTGEELKTPEMPAETDWAVCFSLVENRDQAATWWQKAYDAGVSPEEMARLKEIADARLAELAAPVEGEREFWERRFSGVSTVANAGVTWEAARAAGVEPMELNRLVGLAQQRLRELGISG